jgi:NAD(P)-dependent dehydrogenase (short-subunit alcohol dehydrogenase family)
MTSESGTTAPIQDIASLFGLQDRVSIVTGASSGLGERFARVLAGAGSSVVVAARRRDRLDDLVKQIGGDALAVECDVADPEQTQALTDAAIERFGRVDILVNNAGIGTPVAAEDETIERFRQTLDVNLTGLFALSQQVGRTMIERGSGSIVNIASILGLIASAPIKQAAYCASKGGVVNLTRELAAQWARKGIRVNAIAPGWFPSEMTQELMFDAESGQDFIKVHCPMARGGEPSELDGALLYLAGDASSYVTGEVLAVDGGWVIR